MNDELKLLLLLDVQATGQGAFDDAATELERLAEQSGLALQQLAPLGGAIDGLAAGMGRLGAAIVAGLAGIDWVGASTTLATGLQQALAAAITAVQTSGIAAELSSLIGGLVAAVDWAGVGSALQGFGPLLDGAVIRPAEEELGALGQNITETLAGLGAAIDAALAGIAGAAGAALAGLGGAIAGAGPRLAGAVGAVVTGMDQALTAFLPEALSQGGQIVYGLWQGIAGLAGWFATQVPAWLDANVLAPVQTFFGIAGPSTVMAGIGVALVQGLMDGITSLATTLLDTATALVAPLPAALSAFQADFTAVGTALVEALAGGIQAKAGEIADQARAVVQGAIDAARAVLGGIQTDIGAARAAMSSLGGSNIGHNAGGTAFWRGGLTWVGEQGPELINLPRGAQVIPLAGTAALPPSAGFGGVTVYVSGNTIMSEQDADLLAGRVGQAIVRQTGLAYSLVR